MFLTFGLERGDEPPLELAMVMIHPAAVTDWTCDAAGQAEHAARG